MPTTAGSAPPWDRPLDLPLPPHQAHSKPLHLSLLPPLTSLCSFQDLCNPNPSCFLLFLPALAPAPPPLPFSPENTGEPTGPGFLWSLQTRAQWFLFCFIRKPWPAPHNSTQNISHLPTALFHLSPISKQTNPITSFQKFPGYQASFVHNSLSIHSFGNKAKSSPIAYRNLNSQPRILSPDSISYLLNFLIFLNFYFSIQIIFFCLGVWPLFPQPVFLDPMSSPYALVSASRGTFLRLFFPICEMGTLNIPTSHILYGLKAIVLVEHQGVPAGGSVTYLCSPWRTHLLLPNYGLMSPL